MGHHCIQGNATKIKALAAGNNRGQNALGIGGRQDKDHAIGGFLQGFEQGIKGGSAQHVAIVD